MIDFNNSRISEDGKKLIIEVSVSDSQYYDDMYIDKIIIDTHRSYVPFGPSDNPVYIWDDPNPVIVHGQIVRKRSVRLELSELNLKGNPVDNTMFYVYVLAGGDVAPNAPCEGKLNNAIRVVFDYGPIYRRLIGNFKQIEKECNVPQVLIDDILKINALEMSIMTGHYLNANKYWLKFFEKKRGRLPISKCGCNE